MAIELETLQIIIEANFDKLQQNLDKYLPRLESAVNKIEQVTGRTMDKVESNLDIDRVTQKLSDQFDKMNKQSENQMKRFEELFGKAGEKASKNLASGLGNGRKGAIKEIESTMNEIGAKIRQAEAQQGKIAYLEAQRQNVSSSEDQGKAVRYDEQIANAQAKLTNYQNVVRTSIRSIKEEYKSVGKSIEEVSSKMANQKAAINEQKAKTKELTALYEKQADKVSKATKDQKNALHTKYQAQGGVFAKGFEKEMENYGYKFEDNEVSAKTRAELEKQNKVMNEMITRFNALSRAQSSLKARNTELSSGIARVNEVSAQAKDRAGALKEAISSLNTNLSETSVQTGNAQLGVQSLGDNVNDDTAKVSRWGGIWNRTSNVIAHGIRRINNSFRQTNRSSNRFFRSVDKESKKSSKSMSTINSVLKSITRRLIVFGLIYKSITTFGSYLTKALKTNEQFAASLNQIKVNMATAFYPIYSAALPAINALMSTLVKVTGYIASFIATLFGTTYSFAKKGAEDLQNAIDDMDDAKNTAKKLQQQLAGFDEINTLSFNSDDDQAGAGGLNWDAEEPETPAWLTNFANKFKKIMSQLFDPIRKAWDKQGKKVMNAFKYSLSEVLGLTKAIGDSFMDVWTNGTGQRFVENLLILFADLLNIIGDVARAFKDAWVNDGRGTALIQSYFDKWNAILELLHEIAEAFRAAWNDNDLGESIAANILEIITNVNKAIEGLANRFKEAWKEGNKGQSILTSILKIVNNVLDGVRRLAEASVEWVKELDLNPLLESVDLVLKAFEPITKSLADGIVWIYENVLLPLAGFVITDLLPTFLTTLAKALDMLGAILSVVGPALSYFFENVLVPIGQWLATEIVQELELLGDAFGAVAGFFEKHGKTIEKVLLFIVAFVTEVVKLIIAIFVRWGKTFGIFGNILDGFFHNVENIWNSIKRVLMGFINFILGGFTGDWRRAWQGVSDIFGGIFDGLVALVKSPINAILSLINTMIDGLNGINIDIPKWVPGFGGKKFGFDIPKVKYLAKGGILTRATLFGKNGNENLVGGEAGPEAVLPLNAQVLGGIGAGIASTMGSFSEIIMPDALSSPMPSFAGTVSDQTFSIESLKSSIVEAILLGFQEANIQDTTGDIIIPVSIGTDPLEQILLTTEDRRRLRSNK